jgi:hypothetical protein
LELHGDLFCVETTNIKNAAKPFCELYAVTIYFIDMGSGVLELESSKTNGKIIILETEYCQDFDCETYFQDYQDQIQIFSMEDAFMRGITNYIEIEKIDEEKGQILLSQRKGDEYKEIEINL